MDLIRSIGERGSKLDLEVNVDGADTELTLCSRTPTVGRPVSYQLHQPSVYTYIM